MADLQHTTLLSNQVHEPKHFTTALASQAGQVLTPSAVDGVSELRALTPQEVGVLQHYGEMQLINNNTAVTVPAAVDSSLYTISDYVLITQAFATFTAGDTDGITLNPGSNELVIPETGMYQTNGWMTISQGGATCNVGLRFTVNGVVNPTGATVRRTLSGSGTDLGSVSAGGLSLLNQGDLIGIAIACTSARDITLHEGNFSIHAVSNV